MTKSVSKVLTTSTAVVVAATAINQAEALNDHPKQHRLRTLQDEGEDASSASTSLSMPTNVESISNLMEDEKPKFQEKKEKLDIGILMSSVMKHGEFADTVSQAFDEMGEWDKQDLVEKVDELVDLVKHLLHGSKSGKSKSGKSESKSGKSEGKIVFVDVLINLVSPYVFVDVLINLVSPYMYFLTHIPHLLHRCNNYSCNNYSIGNYHSGNNSSNNYSG